MVPYLPEASPLWSPCSFTVVAAYTNIEVPCLLEAFHIVALASNIFRNLEFVVQYENLTSLMPTMPMPHHQSQLIVCVT